MMGILIYTTSGLPTLAALRFTSVIRDGCAFAIAGVAGLAGLFSTCLDVIDRVESYKDFGLDSQSISCQFEAEGLLFRRWAQKVGIGDCGLKEDHHKDLDDPEIALMVEKLLLCIQKIFSVTETTFPNPNQSLQANPIASQGRSQHYELHPASKRSKIGWAIKGKTKFITQVQQFGALVRILETLVSPVGSKKPFNVHQSRTDDDIHFSEADFLDKATWFSDSQRILMEVEKQIENERRKELDGWLNASRTNTLYDDFSRKRLDSTCNWILDRPFFVDWISPDFPSDTAKMLWVNGPPGYGKTILCARMVQHLLRTLISPVAHYFFSSDSENRGDPFDIIRSWISQVISSNQDAFELACERWDAKAGQSASRTDMIELFQDIVKMIPKCTFVVDGLDEYAWPTESWRSNDDDSAIGLLRIIKQAIACTATRILIVSRDEIGIRSGFHATLPDRPLTLVEIKISPKDVQSDAMLFSRSVVDKKLANKNEILRHELTRRIVDRCEGMFLWVKMLEDQLRGGKNKKQLEYIVDHTPTALDHLYHRNWVKISTLPDRDRDRAFSILRWTVCGRRPLTVLELTEALLIMDDDDYDDLLVDQLPDDIDEEYVNTEILGLCGSLLETRSGSSMTVEPIHFSAKQYILCNMPLPGMLKTNERLHYSNEARHNTFLARLCLRYINFNGVWHAQGQQDTDVVTRAFRDYAAGSWYQHFNQDYTDCEAVRLINTLFHPQNKNWESWRIWFDKVDQGWKFPSDISNVSSLYYASLLGLQDAVMFLTDNLKLELNYRDGLNRTALLGACVANRASMAKLLLEKGADMTIADNDGWTPLNKAASKGNIEVVKLLLDKGVDLTIANNDGWTPLNTAALYGHIERVKLLVEKGADSTIANNNRWTPLNTATSEGHIEVVKLLLDKGADLTIANNSGWTPLHTAALSGYVEEVKLLLAQNGLDPNSKDRTKRTPLSIAAKKGFNRVVMVLLTDDRVELNSKDHYGSTPLSMAVRNDHIEVVKLLLDTGRVDVETRDCFERTPLWYARRYGNVDITQLLLYNAEMSGIPLSENDLPVEVSLRPPNVSSIWCDVCTLNIQKDGMYYHCNLCNGGDFDVCWECHEIGGHCLEVGHELVQKYDGEEGK